MKVKNDFDMYIVDDGIKLEEISVKSFEETPQGPGLGVTIEIPEILKEVLTPAPHPVSVNKDTTPVYGEKISLVTEETNFSNATISLTKTRRSKAKSFGVVKTLIDETDFRCFSLLAADS